MKAWEENIRKVVPYVPGEQPQVKDIIKLNTNENPYPPSPGVKKAHEEMEVSRFALYPDPAAKELVTALESYHGLDAGQVFVGVGSDDVLALAFLTFFNSDKPILFPDVTYSFYPVWANVYRIPYECPKLTDDFRICPDDYKKENGGVVIANPNAPTSLALSRDEIEEIIAANQDVIVIVDEAYIDFGGESALSLLPKYENLLVVRTYSKSRSMAGMRIGYAMGNKRLIQAMTDVKESINSYTMTRESIALGAASLADEEYFQEKKQMVVVGLKINRSGVISAPCAPCNLRQKLKSPLTGAKIRQIEPVVRVYYAHKRHIRVVQPFCNHLRADKNVDFAL